jgi:hypothetical protein
VESEHIVPSFLARDIKDGRFSGREKDSTPLLVGSANFSIADLGQCGLMCCPTLQLPLPFVRWSRWGRFEGSVRRGGAVGFMNQPVSVGWQVFYQGRRSVPQRRAAAILAWARKRGTTLERQRSESPRKSGGWSLEQRKKRHGRSRRRGLCGGEDGREAQEREADTFWRFEDLWQSP